VKRGWPIIIHLILYAGLIMASSHLSAQITWYVDDNATGDPGPGDPLTSDPLEDGSTDHPFDAIQEGIDAASDSDTIIVADGTYTGTGNRDMDFDSRAIVVRSENNAISCIIDCQANPEDRHNGFNFQNGEGHASVVHGFTITNGYSPYHGGGIFCDASSPTITNNIITGNYGTSDGGGIYCESSDAFIAGNIISNNWTYDEGGGIRCSGGNPVIKNNLIHSNQTYNGNGGGIYCESALITDNTISGNTSTAHGGGICCGSAAITHNVISSNWAKDGDGGGIYCGSAMIGNNLIYSNSTDRSGGGIYRYFSNGTATIYNCTLTGNLAYQFHTGEGIYGSGTGTEVTNCIIWNNGVNEVSGTISLTYSDIKDGYPGIGNINADPLFESSSRGDYFLLQSLSDSKPSLISPCINTGDPASEMIHGTNRVDNVQDMGVIDMGYHYRPCIPAGHQLNQ